MARKIKVKQSEVEEAKLKLQEAERVLQEAEKEVELAKVEEQGKIDTIKHTIDVLCVDNNLFCGVKLSQNDVIEIIKLLIQSKDDYVTIKYNIYINE